MPGLQRASLLCTTPDDAIQVVIFCTLCAAHYHVFFMLWSYGVQLIASTMGRLVCVPDPDTFGVASVTHAGIVRASLACVALSGGWLQPRLADCCHATTVAVC